MTTAYLQVNGVDYELPAYLAKQPDQLAQLADRFASFVKDRPAGHQIQDVVIRGASASLVINTASVAAAAVYVVDGEALRPPNLF